MNMESIPLWRNVYKTISRQCTTIGPTSIRTALNAVEKDLLLGLMTYKTYTLESFTGWKNDIGFKDKKDLEVLMHRASKLLNLDCRMMYSLFCNFIMFEFYGKLDDIERLAKVEVSCTVLLDKLWLFYSTERMFLLKTQRFIIEKSQDRSHENYDLFQEFTRNNPLGEFKKSFIGQFKLLTHELHSRVMITCKNPKRWVDRNNSETIEVVCTFMYLCKGIQYTPEEIVAVMLLFTEHDFGRRPIEYYESLQMSEKEDLETILLMEYAVFLVMIEPYWADNSWLKHFKSFEKMMTLEMTRDHLVVMFLWCLLIMSIPSERLEPNYEEILPHYLEKCFTNETFDVLLKIVNSPFLKDSSLQVIIKEALYPVLNFIAMKIENPYFVVTRRSSLQLLASVMEVEEICEKIVDPLNSINVLFVVAINVFPFDFHSLTECALSMLKHKNLQDKVIQFLLNIEVYAEVAQYTSMETMLILSEQKVVNGFVIPANTKATVVHMPNSEAVMQFSGTFTYTYFHILEDHLSKTLAECDDEGSINEAISLDIEASISGMKLISNLLKIKPELLENKWFHQCVYQGKLLFSKTAFMDSPNYDLVEKTFSMCVDLMSIQEVQTTQLLISSRCIPTISAINYSVPGLFKGNIMNESSIINVISQQTRIGKFDVLHIYMELWRNTLESTCDPEKVHIPGLVYFLHEIFPHHLNWKFNTEFEKVKIANTLLKYIFEVIHSPRTTELGTFVHSFCIETLFNYVPFIKTFLAYLKMPNEYIEYLMCREPFWDTGRTLEYITTIRLCLRIVIWMISLKSYDEIKETKFWRYFIHNPTNMCNIAKTTCDYINHRIDPVVPKLACTLLRKICLDSNVPVLSSLEMDNYQVQNIFLERLRDPLVDIDLKVGILELITVCVKKQNGMTAAFFNLTTRKQLQNGNDTDHSDTLLGYFEEYLLNIKEQPEYLLNPIQATLLELFHTLWVEKKTVLIKDLMQKSCFWPILVSPLTKSFNFHATTYAQILDILGIEIFMENMDENLQEVLKKLFVKQSSFINNFPDRIKQKLEESDEEALFLLKSWKKFLIFIIKYHDGIITEDVKMLITKSTMEGMNAYLINPEDTRLIYHYSQLYLYLVSQWNMKDYEDEDSFEKISECFMNLSPCYADLQPKCKETVLSIAIKTVGKFQNFFELNTLAAEQFLQGMLKIVKCEYDEILVIREKKKIFHSNYSAWILVIKFTSLLFKFESQHRWIYFTQMLTKTTEVVGHFCSHEKLLPVAKLSIYFLIMYIKSPLYKEVLYVDFQGLFDSMKFPRNFFDYSPLQFQGSQQLPYEEFWLAYTCLVNMNLTLIERFDTVISHVILEFVDVHKQDLFKIINLPTVTGNLRALKLVSNTIKLCNNMLKWRASMHLYDEPLLPKYYRVVAESLNACVNILLRPVLMKFCTMDSSMKLSYVDNMPVDFLVNIMERLTDIISSACLGLLDISPNLLEIIAKGGYTTRDLLQFDYEFHIPSSSSQYVDSGRLTFGGILCLVHYLCKSLVQIAKKKKESASSSLVSTSTFMVEKGDTPSKASTSKDYIVFVYPDYPSESISDKFNSIQRFANSEIYSLAAPWLSKMNEKRMTYILEVVTTLLASQVFKAIRETSQNPVQLQLLKRNLCSEIQFYHEFVRKKLMDQHKYVIDGNLVLKNKMCTDWKVSEDLSTEYLLMLSHWFMIVCQLSP